MIWALLAFLAGLLIGSFLSVCIYRLPRDLSVAKPARSFCPSCAELKLRAIDGHKPGEVSTAFENPEIRQRVLRESMIAWYDNIPVISYFILGARCRHCKQRIPVRYTVVELATGAAFALCVAALGLTLPALKYCLYSAIMITLIASDIEERILPDEFTLGGTLVGLAISPFVPLERYFVSIFIPYGWWAGWSSLAESAFAAIVGAGSIWLVGFLYQKIRHREGMGLGDVKMIAMIGAFMGLRVALMTLIVASLLGSVIGLIFIRATKRDAATYELPFGSFLGAAGLLIALAGQVLSVWFPRLAG
jgi:leader peptidase (prepilin peptidase)/N-methyltransferase